MGVLGWSEIAFWDSDLPTLTAALQAKRDNDDRLIREGWEQTRWMVSILLAPHNKGKITQLDKLIRFPWDPEPRKTRPEDYETVIKKLGK